MVSQRYTKNMLTVQHLQDYENIQQYYKRGHKLANPGINLGIMEDSSQRKQSKGIP